MNAYYAQEIITDVTYLLGTHPGPIKDRLQQAAPHILPLSQGDLPNYLLADFERIRQRLTRVASAPGEGPFGASIEAMTEAEAIQLAKDFFGLASNLS